MDNSQTDSSTWAQDTWRSLLGMATNAAEAAADRIRPAPAAPAPAAPSWFSKLDAKQVAIYVVGGLAVLYLGKKLLK